MVPTQSPNRLRTLDGGESESETRYVRSSVCLGSEADAVPRVELVRFRGPSKRVCKPNCKPTTRHRTVSGIIGRHRHGKIYEPERTLSYRAAHASTRILELENRCTGNRTVGSSPTLSA